VTLLTVVVERRVVGARLAQGFAGRFLVAKACILVFLEVFVVRFFPNVFIALDSGFLPADTLFEGGCGGVVKDTQCVESCHKTDIITSLKGTFEYVATYPKNMETEQ
jgi:hypothetical protein